MNIMLSENWRYVNDLFNYKHHVNEPFESRNEINGRTAQTLTLC
jgi:hypothetical protein